MDYIEEYYYSLEDSEEPVYKWVHPSVLNTITGTIVLSMVACLLKYLTIKAAFIPSAIAIELSNLVVLPALFVYGVVPSIFILMAKCACSYFVFNAMLINVMQDVSISMIMILIATIIFFRKNSKHSVKDVVISCVAVTIATTICCTVFVYFITFPYLQKSAGFTTADIVNTYQFTLGYCNNLKKCVLFVNAPWQFVKQCLSSVLAIGIYKIMYD